MATAFRSRAHRILMAAAFLCMSSGSALSQQSGTVLRESLTLLGSTTATMEIDVVGPKTANTETNLLLEFGPDGNSSTNPTPDPQLAATTTFTVSASFGGSRSFMPSGATETGVFADKIVAFEPRDPVNAPGLYSLSIIHLKDIPAGVTERWKVLVSGLPSTGLRAVASVQQGTFRSLSPIGASQGPPAIIPEPLFVAGTAPALTVKSSGGLDLSRVALSQVVIVPPDGISILGVNNATPGSAVVSLGIAKCAASGERALTIQGQNAPVSMVFLIEAPGPPAISITPDQGDHFVASTVTLNVTSTGCLDLTGITPAGVRIDPFDGISGLSVGNVTPSSATVSFDIANCAPPGARTLTIRNQDISASTSFVLLARPPGIGVMPSRVEQSSSVTLNVRSIGCFSLAGVPQVRIDPPDGLTHLTIGAASATSLTLSFDVASDARLGDHRLVIVNDGASAVAAFDVVRAPPPPPPFTCPHGQLACCGSDVAHPDECFCKASVIGGVPQHCPPRALTSGNKRGDCNMIAGSGHRWRGIALAAALANLGSAAAVSQQSGTVLRENLTLLGSTTVTTEIDVAGPKTANSETDLLLEFGPDGNSSTNPAPDPRLAATTTFTVSASFGGSRSFMPAGGTETGGFADKIVAFEPRDPANAPGLYALSIIHLKDIPAGMTETWKVQISGLPGAGLRAVASVRQGTFRSLSPTGLSQGPPTISLQPPPFSAGSTSALTVRSSAGLDLLHLALPQVTIDPADGIAVLGVGNTTPNSAVISFSIAKCAAEGERTLTIRDHDVSASTVFAVAAQQAASTISVVPNGVITFSSATLNVASFGCLDLTGLTPAQVVISPADGISGITVAVISATSANISFEVAEDAQLGNHTLSIVKGGANAADGFGIIRHPPSHQGGACGAGQKCCGQSSGGSCSGECIPRNRTCQ